MEKNELPCWVALAIIAGLVLLAVFVWKFPEGSGEWASWMQALGTIFAIFASHKLGAKQATAAHESALRLEGIKVKRREDGLKKVADYLAKECRSAAEVLRWNRNANHFASAWRERNSESITVALKLFDAMPIYDMDAFDKVVIALKIREIASAMSKMGDEVNPQGSSHGFHEYSKCLRQFEGLAGEAEELSNKLSSLS